MVLQKRYDLCMIYFIHIPLSPVSCDQKSDSLSDSGMSPEEETSSSGSPSHPPRPSLQEGMDNAYLLYRHMHVRIGVNCSEVMNKRAGDGQSLLNQLVAS